MAINPTAMPPKTETPAPEIAPEVLTGMKQYPFLKEQQAAGEKASEASIKAKLLQESTALEEKGKALEKIGSEDKAYYEDVKGKMEKPPEFKPTQENAMELGSIFSLIGTMGVALGGSGKLSGLNALNAMGGMLKGWQQGKKDVFEKEQKIFDKEVARIKSANDMLLKDLEIYQKLSITDKEAKLIKGQEIASKNPGIGAALIESGKANVLYEIAKKNTDIHTEIIKLAEKNRVSGKALTKDILPAIQGIRGINDLETQLNDPEVQAGLKAKVAPILEKIASLGKKDFEAAVNENLTGTDKTTLFLKSALLESYAIERAALGGGRLTVQMMKQAGPVLDPTNYRPETYKALLEGRRRQLYNNLQDLGMSQKDIQEKSAEHAYTPYGGQATLAATQTVTTQEQYDALPSGATYIEDGKRYKKP